MNEDHDRVVDLVSRARSGDVEAFEALYHGHQAGVYSFVLSQVRERDLAADLVQDTFVRAWESLPRLRQPGAFRGWLYRIARNLVRDEMKSGRARVEVSEAALSGDGEGAEAPLAERTAANAEKPEEELVRQEMKAQVWQALETLPPEQREAVVLHHMEGMGMQDIAEVTGVRPGTVMSRLARAREALRKHLSRYVEGQDEGM